MFLFVSYGLKLKILVNKDYSMVVGTLAFMALVIFLGVFGEFVFSKTKVPDALWLIAIGFIAGPVLGLVAQSQLWAIAPLFSAIALMVIMFEGGLHLNIYDVIKSAPTSILLAVVGFLLNVAIIAVLLEGLGAFGYIPNWGLTNSILLGSILGGSSSLVVLPLVRQAKLRDRVSNILTLESSITDVLAVVITITIIHFVLAPEKGIQGIMHAIAGNFSIGAVLGVLVGIAWIYVLEFFKNRERLYTHNYMLTFACLLLLYAFTQFVEGSAAIAALTFGIVLGNSTQLQNMLKLKTKIKLDKKVMEFNSQVSFFVKTFFFALIGLMFVVDMSLMLASFLIVIGILVARPLAVKLGTFREKFSKKEADLVNGLIPRGLAAAVLAILPASMGVPGTESFSAIVFSVVIATIAITTGIVYFRLKQN